MAFSASANSSLAQAQSVPAGASPYSAAPGAAPSNALPKPAASGGAITNPNAVIGTDDILDIIVLRHPEFSSQNVLVPGDGTITLPVIGNIKTAGKTVAQLDAELTRRFKVRLLRPEISVSIAKPAPRPIYVVGQVRNPNVLEFKNGWRITQALSAAGGLAVDSDLAAVAVSRGNATIADVPLLPILRNPSGPQNLALRVGDTLRFYERVVKINIAGAVAKPGIYAVPRGSGVVDAIGLAGGPLEAASLTRATLRRTDGTVRPVNLYAALRMGDSAQNLPLQEGDVLSIPEFKDRVSVLGAVKIPGFYGLEDGAGNKVADVLARAGGALDGASLTRATLRHANGQNVSLNLYRLLVLGETDNNLALSNGDVLTIPEARGITVIGEVRAPGNYKLEEGSLPHVSDAIARAGGLAVKPELARITLSRAGIGGKTTVLNLDPISLLEQSNPSQNSLVQDGDVLSVSAIKSLTVSIIGQVKTPGTYEIKEGDSIITLLARAGGPTDDGALSQVTINSRNGQSQSIDATSALATGRGLSAPLRDGDTLIVPFSQSRILVIGSVGRPGSYALPEARPINLGEALSLAGGPAGGARVKEVVVLRPVAGGTVAPGQTQAGQNVQRLTFRLDRAQNGQLAVMQPIYKGDVIYIPEGKVRPNSLNLLNSFLPAAAFLLR